MKSTNATLVAEAKKAIVPYTHGLTGVNIHLDVTMTYALWICIALLGTVILLVRFGQMANAHLRHLLNLHSSAHEQSYWSEDHTTAWPWLKKHVLYAPLWKKRHNKEFQLSRAMNVGTLPSRLHTVILLSYLLSNVVYCLYLDYSSPKVKIIAELRGRTGHLSLVNMVPLIVLAGRNSPFIPILRISFDTYNLFHRWIGRVVAAEALAHTLAWAANAYAAGGTSGMNQSLREKPFLQYGLLATVALCLIIVQAASVVRHAFYETFLHIHQLLAIVSIIGVRVHCKIGVLPGQAYIDWVIALWALERGVRLFRILYHNIAPRRLTTVTIEALPGTEVQACRVTIHMARPFAYTPGSHCYIYIPSISFWMNHPFSLAWSETHPTNTLTSEKLDLSRPSSPTTTISSTATTTTHSLIIAKRTGMTAAIFEKALAQPTGKLTTTALIEGPYHSNTKLTSYGTVVLFAAGVGITNQLGHVRHLLACHTAHTSATQKITLVWSVRNTETLEWIRPWMDQILAMPNRKSVLKVLLFVTKPRSQSEVRSRSETVRMFPGRCEPRVVLEGEVRSRVGAMAVGVCGPGAFGDEVRGAVRGLSDGEGEGAVVDFVEESFTW